WLDGCGTCPYPSTLPGVRRGASRIEWRLKRAAYARSRIDFAAPSEWLCDIARRGLPPGSSVECIPNGVDLEVYRPQDRRAARAELDLPDDRHVLMFASVNLSDWRKGGDLLRTMLSALPDDVRAKTMLLLIGPDAGTAWDSLGMPVRSLGSVVDEG